MNILFYINTLVRHGAERVVANLSEQFAEHGHKVFVATTEKNEVEYQLNPKIKRYVLEPKYEKNKIISNTKRCLALRKICIDEKIDVLVSFMKEANIRSILATSGLKTKVIVSVRSDPRRTYSGLFGYVLRKYIMPLADGCVFQTESAKSWFPIELQKKSTIIFNPVNESFYTTTYSGARKNIVTTGRLYKQKNHELLIKAFASVANQIEDNLIIYGEGPERVNLEKLIYELGLSERIILPGSVNNVPETIKSAKLYVLSSDHEGMPNALMEAMALGLPCISTDCPCGGPRALIKNNKNGILVEVNNLNQLANTMLKLLQNECKLSELGINARLSAMKYKPNDIFRQWNDFITKGFIL